MTSPWTDLWRVRTTWQTISRWCRFLTKHCLPPKIQGKWLWCKTVHTPLYRRGDNLLRNILINCKRHCEEHWLAFYHLIYVFSHRNFACWMQTSGEGRIYCWMGHLISIINVFFSNIRGVKRRVRKWIWVGLNVNTITRCSVKTPKKHVGVQRDIRLSQYVNLIYFVYLL